MAIGYHIRRAKRAQLYLEDIQSRLREYYQDRSSRDRNWRHKGYVSLSKLVRATKISREKLHGYLVAQTKPIPSDHFDLILLALGISLRELIVPAEYGPTVAQEPDTRLSSLDQHLRTAVRELDRLSAYNRQNIRQPWNHRVSSYLFQITEEVYAICDLYGLSRSED